MINTKLLTQLASEVSQKPNYSQLLQGLKKKYHTNIKDETPQQIEEYAAKINQRYQQELQYTRKHKRNAKIESWGFGQLKIFEWVSLFIISFKEVQTADTVKPQLPTKSQIARKIKNIFPKKSLEFIKYEYMSLLKSQSTKEWKQAQEQMLFNIIEQHVGIKQNKPKNSYWKYYSFLLFTRSKGKFYKSQKQCREKWSNHLNPKVKRISWSTEENIRLLEFIKQHGFKWSLISSLFGHQRTEHMVKNRYHSIAKSWTHADRKNVLNQELVSKILSTLYKERINQSSVAYQLQVGPEKKEISQEAEGREVFKKQNTNNLQNKVDEVSEFVNEYEYDESQPERILSNEFQKPLELNLNLDFHSQNEKQEIKRTRDDDQEYYSYAKDDSLNIFEREDEDASGSFREFDPFVFESWRNKDDQGHSEGKEYKQRINLLKEVTDILQRDQISKIDFEDDFLKQLQEKAYLQWLQ